MEKIIFSDVRDMKCPSCGEGWFQFVNKKLNGILVNVETRGKKLIDNFWVPSLVCDNPLCEWSKVKIESLNKDYADDAWEEAKLEGE